MRPIRRAFENIRTRGVSEQGSARRIKSRWPAELDEEHPSARSRVFAAADRAIPNRGEQVVEILKIHGRSERELPKVIGALSSFCCFLCFAQGGQQHAG